MCYGDVLGQVGLLDPLSLQTVASFPAHEAGMCDMDIVGNYLVTCGLSRAYVGKIGNCCSVQKVVTMAMSNLCD